MNSQLLSKRYVVKLGGITAGHLLQKGDWTSFELDDEYLSDADHPILGLYFEENWRTPYTSALRLPPWFSNLLPESPLREWIARDRNVSVDREMELLAQVGSDLPGAVLVEPDPESGWNFKELPQTPADRHAWDFSLAGVALKFSMLQQGERLTLATQTDSGSWIMKPPDPKFRNVPLNEYAMMRLAREAGIEVPDVRLVQRDEVQDLPDSAWTTGESLAYLVKRYDRALDGKRVHAEDFLQILNRYPQDKYRGNFETVAALAYRHRDLESLIEMVRRLTFNILISNGDAHLKNWSLIYDRPTHPRLSPAYDLVSTRPYLDSGTEDLGLKLRNNKAFRRVHMVHIGLLGRRLGVERSILEDVARQTISRVQAAWPLAEEILAPDAVLRDSIGLSIREHAKQLLGAGL